MTANQPQQSEDAPGANMMKSMNVTMPLMSVFFCFSFASGIGLYWVAQSVFTIIQQVGINSYLNKVDIDDLVQKNIEKTNKKRAKKGLPPTKVGKCVDEMLKKIGGKGRKGEQAQMAKIARPSLLLRSLPSTIMIMPSLEVWRLRLTWFPSIMRSMRRVKKK